MSGTKLTLKNTDAKKATKIAWRTAENLGYRLVKFSDREFTAEQGSFVLNILFGGFCPHIRFAISADEYDDGTVDLVLERRQNFWFNGFIGVSTIKSRSEALMSEVADSLEDAGAQVVRQREI